jgi:NADPH:quinone reductase-like Zn-dependent oxidoreductase
MTRAFSISSADIATESERTGGDLKQFDVSRVIALDTVELREVGPDDVHMRILAVSAEHNINHAALADTVNIAEFRGGKVYPGNSALGEVVSVGADVTRFSAGDIVITHCNGGPDEYGYPTRIWAYDAEDSIGWYGEEAVVGEWQLIPAPLECGLNLWEIAALPLRAPTAHHLWRRGLGIYRLKVSSEKQEKLTVMGFGGGVSELFLMIAQSQGHQTFFCSGSKERREHLATLGIEGIDQREFNRFAGRDDVKAFYKHVLGLTDGKGMNIVCDMMRGPLFGAGLRVASRQGVNVSAGWQLDTANKYNSANLSVRQVTLDHSHYETIEGCNAATELYGSVFKPTIHNEIYDFEDLPRAFRELEANTQTGIPIIRIAKDMPESVKALIP